MAHSANDAPGEGIFRRPLLLRREAKFCSIWIAMEAVCKRSFACRLVLAVYAFFRALGASLYAETCARLARLTFFQLALRLLIFVVGVSVIQEICNNNPVLDVVNVPKEFQDAGYTPEVVARRIKDQIQEIDTEEKSLPLQPQFLELASDSPMPDLQLPEAGVSLKTAILFVRQLLRFPPERILVDVTSAPASTASSPSDGKTLDRHPRSAQLWVIVRRVGGSAPTPDQIRTDDFESALPHLAQDVMFEADPSVLGAYLLPNAPERSERCFKKAAELDPQNALAFDAWGGVLGDEGKFAEAITKFQHAIQLKPKDALAYNNWGGVLADQGKFTDAAILFRRAIQLDPRLAVAHNNWGYALENQGKFADAINEFQIATALEPKISGFYYNWGGTLARQGKFADAVAKFKQAIDLDPKNVGAYISWGTALLAEGQDADAIAEFRQATVLSPSSADAYYAWGAALNAQGKYEDSIVKFQQTTALDPKYTLAYNDWGFALIAKGMYAEAISKCQQATQLNPTYFPAYYNWARALDLLGRHEEAKTKLAIAENLRKQSTNPP